MYTLSNDQQMLHCPSTPLLLERSWKPHLETAPNCPRCASSNTKFCYYNNYSFSQPRYFCKGCRRYWTKGGSLRNVPVGGGCRKSRRSTHKSSVRLPSITTARYSHQEITCQASNTDSCDAQDSDSIDLAAVFAKFLNHNSSSDGNSTELEGQELADSGNLSCKVVDDHCGGVVEGQEPSDLGMDCQLEEVVSVMYVDNHNLLQQQEECVHELTRTDEPNLFGLDALISDQVVEDALWSDATALPSLTWQPMVQFQEFDQTLSWNSSFDLSSYELFSRP